MAFQNQLERSTEKKLFNTDLTFTIAESCFSHGEQLSSIVVTNVTAGSTPDVYCYFIHKNNKCTSDDHTKKCSCDPGTGKYTVYIPFTGVDEEAWKITGKLTTDTEMFEDSFKMGLKCEYNSHERLLPRMVCCV